MRAVLGTLAGLGVAVAVVAVLEALGHSLFPPPADLDLSRPEALSTLMSRLPRGAIVAVLVAWTIGAFAGAATAARITGLESSAVIVGVLMLAAAAWTMLQIPHPLWFMIASVPATLLPAWLAGRWLSRSQEPRA